MRKLLILAVSICFITLSCFGTRTETMYFKSFFIDEKAFIFEAESFFPDPINFDYFIVKPNIFSTGGPEGWKITGEILSDKKIRVLIDTVSDDGIILEKDTITAEKNYVPLFPDNFPVMELEFYTIYNDSPIEWFIFPYYKERRFNSDRTYRCRYIYVAEPINLSGTETGEGSDKFGDYNYIHHYDFNFPKVGWYKIICNYYQKFPNDNKLSSTTNNFFQ